jgi:hypothetical protein
VTKSKGQIAILTIGLISLILGIWTMLQIPTVILPSWFLLVIFLPVAFLISLGLGYVAKTVVKPRWHLLTHTSLFITLICLSFYVTEYRPTHKVIVPIGYVGEVKLLVTGENRNDFKISEFGVGYINMKTFKKGFHPIVIRDGQDISKQIEGYNTAAYATTAPGKLSFEYVSFKVPGEQDKDILSIDDLIRLNYIDTGRIKRR